MTPAKADRRRYSRVAAPAPPAADPLVPRPDFPIAEVMEQIRCAVADLPTPVVTVYSQNRATPYEILISTIISLRTQDRTTAEASARLFAVARTPEQMVRRRVATIARLIYPAGFYQQKARTIRDISRTLLDEYGGQVPDDVDELTRLKGVGRKTANLVVTLGFGKPGICVDTHVHRIPNRWGWIATRTPDETETLLRRILPRRYWIPINDWLVAYGQHLCRPVSPRCSACVIKSYCAGVGVDRAR